MQAPWYTYFYDKDFGTYPDPVGPYAKPDANVRVPTGTPITAIASGTVTGVRRQPWGPLAYSITVRMDAPWNNVARYTAYNYVSSPQVHIGQHVNFGTPLAIAGNPYGIWTAFALSDSPVYGTGTKNSPFAGRYINPALNPVPFLQAVNSGSHPGTTQLNPLNSSNLMQDSSTQTNNPLDITSGLTNWLDSIKAGVVDAGWHVVDAALLFILGLTLVIVGGMLILNRGISVPGQGS